MKKQTILPPLYIGSLGVAQGRHQQLRDDLQTALSKISAEVLIKLFRSFPDLQYRQVGQPYVKAGAAASLYQNPVYSDLCCAAEYQTEGDKIKITVNSGAEILTFDPDTNSAIAIKVNPNQRRIIYVPLLNGSSHFTRPDVQPSHRAESLFALARKSAGGPVAPIGKRPFAATDNFTFG